MTRLLRLTMLLVVILCGASAWCQLYSGSITGRVTDSTGALVPHASVTLTNENQGVPTVFTTDDTGRYVFRGVTPGSYRIQVAARGFESVVREGIKIDVGQNVSADFAMNVGATSDVVNVTAEAPLLSTEDATTGQVIGRHQIEDLPMLARDPSSLAYLAPGVVSAYNGNPGTGQQGNNFISSGSRNATADVLLDGATATNYEQNGGIQVPSYTPSPDAVEEFTVQTSNFNAEFGFSGATVINMVTRSGTNQFHGSAYDYLRNQILDANNYFANQAGQSLPNLHRNNFGGTIGGPIQKNKTFFFFDYDGLRQAVGKTANFGVPSALEREGNFGELCGYNGGTFDSAGICSAPGGQLWDPYSGVYSAAAGGAVRSVAIPFNDLSRYVSPGNPRLNGTGYQLQPVPGNLIDPVALKMMQYMPLPNLNVGSPNYEYYNNWFGSGAQINRNDQWDAKIDHHFSDNSNLAIKFSRDVNFQHMWSCFGNAGDPCNAGPTNGAAHLATINFTRAFTPKVLLTLSYGFNRVSVDEAGAMGDYPNIDPVDTLGLPQYMKRSNVPTFPAISIGDAYSSAWGVSVGTWPWTYIRGGSDTHQLMGTVSWLRGNHDFKFGVEGRMHRINYTIPGATGGYFGYNYSGTSQSPDPASGGDAMATFLMGTSNWGSYEVMAPTSTQSFQWGGFAQDNWKMRPNLTLSVGLRYDLSMPRTERFNRQNWVDPNMVSPLNVPALGTLYGGEVFASPDNRTNYDPDFTNFQPRIGISWEALNNTVIRAGYGIYYSVSQSGAAGKGGTGQQGYTVDTPQVTTYQNDGATPWGRLSDPFPNVGPLLPPGNSLGALNDVGYSAIGPVRSVNSIPYEQTWSLGVQRQLPWSMLIDAEYVGKKGTHLYFGGTGNYNILPTDVVNSMTPEQLLSYVPNPFYGIITDPNTPFSASTIQAYQLKLPYPQFQSFGGDPLPIANSIYHGLQIKAEKKFSNDLQFLVTYTFSKSIDDSDTTSGNVSWLGGGTSLQDPHNPQLERSVSQFNLTHVLKISHVYALPIGRGKLIGRNLNPIANAFLGGWNLNGIWSFQSGYPLQMGLQGGYSLPTYGGQRPDLLGRPKRNTGSDWMNNYFANPEVFATPAPYAVGNAPRTLPWVTTPGLRNADLSLFKEFSLEHFREGMKLQYRLEAFNAFNHPLFNGPNTTVNSDSFGKVTSQANSPREVQMALKFYF